MLIVSNYLCRVAVRLNEHSISTTQDCFEDNCLDPVQDIYIGGVVKHELFDYQKLINDIALIRLATAADMTRNKIRTICLPSTPASQIEEIDQDIRDKMIVSGKS